MEELRESRSPDLIHGPGIFSEEPGETGKESGKEKTRQGLDPGGGMPLLSQLEKAHNEGRKYFEGEA
jgi:hypothetical protein